MARIELLTKAVYSYKALLATQVHGHPHDTIGAAILLPLLIVLSSLFIVWGVSICITAVIKNHVMSSPYALSTFQSLAEYVARGEKLPVPRFLGMPMLTECNVRPSNRARFDRNPEPVRIMYASAARLGWDELFQESELVYGSKLCVYDVTGHKMLVPQTTVFLILTCIKALLVHMVTFAYRQQKYLSRTYNFSKDQYALDNVRLLCSVFQWTKRNEFDLTKYMGSTLYDVTVSFNNQAVREVIDALSSSKYNYLLKDAAKFQSELEKNAICRLRLHEGTYYDVQKILNSRDFVLYGVALVEYKGDWYFTMQDAKFRTRCESNGLHIKNLQSDPALSNIKSMLLPVSEVLFIRKSIMMSPSALNNPAAINCNGYTCIGHVRIGKTLDDANLFMNELGHPPLALYKNRFKGLSSTYGNLESILQLPTREVPNGKDRIIFNAYRDRGPTERPTD